MKKEKIKTLPFVKKLYIYFEGRARRVLKLKRTDYDHSSIDVHPNRGTIWVWFHNPDKVVARAQFYFDGRCYEKAVFSPEEDDEK